MPRKFIITAAGHFRLGNVSLHRDLLQPGDVCIGGGLYEFDYVSARLILTRRSYDFGYPEWQRLASRSVSLKVPEAYRGMRLIYKPDAESDPILCLNEILTIEYV